MNTEETRAILTVCLLAAYADGDKHDREREQIRQVAEGLAQDQQVNLPSLYQDVLMRRIQLADILPKLASAEARQLAYEMAVCVCEADGQTSAREQDFLARLREGLGQAPTEFVAQADALAAAPLQATSPAVPVLAAAGGPAPHPTAVDALPSS
ncbi:MAG: tellurite resistance TerB family protein, partial [Pigmentiphaga sp.]